MVNCIVCNKSNPISGESDMDGIEENSKESVVIQSGRNKEENGGQK